MKFEACQESASRVDNMRAKQSVRREGEFRRSTTIVSARMTVVGVGAAPFVVAQDHRVVWSQPIRGLGRVTREAPTRASWIVYVDGLNFYAAVRGRPETKWIDFNALADRLVPSGDSVSKVKYFTSQISAKASEDSDAPRRQRVLIRAIRATGVEVLEGKFKVPDDWRAISSRRNWEDRFRPPPPAKMLDDYSAHFATHRSRPWKALVELPQEKFTDVAIASHLLRDFYQGACDRALVVSNDSDLRPAIELAVEDGHHVGVFSPMETVSRDLARVSSWAKPIRPELLVKCQMPDEVRAPGSSTTLSRPALWK